MCVCLYLCTSTTREWLGSRRDVRGRQEWIYLSSVVVVVVCMQIDPLPPPLLFLFLSLFCIITKDQIISDGAWLVGWRVGGYVNGRGGLRAQS